MCVRKMSTRDGPAIPCYHGSLPPRPGYYCYPLHVKMLLRRLLTLILPVCRDVTIGVCTCSLDGRLISGGPPGADIRNP
jgi:hypothetical protein